MNEPNAAGAPPGETFTPDQLKGALKAFRKKLKSMRLDQESGKAHGPLSSGKTSGIVAITPPAQFPRGIWEVLAKQGRLGYEGQGLYKLVDE
jgi:hypothetical protein